MQKEASGLPGAADRECVGPTAWSGTGTCCHAVPKLTFMQFCFGRGLNQTFSPHFAEQVHTYCNLFWLCPCQLHRPTSSVRFTLGRKPAAICFQVWHLSRQRLPEISCGAGSGQEVMEPRVAITKDSQDATLIVLCAYFKFTFEY